MPNQSLLFAKEPAWSNCRRVNYRHIPYAVRSWLFEADSITKRLRAIYGDKINVKLLRQCWDKPFLGEKRLLQQAHRRRCLIREVLLQANDQPLVLARTVIPAQTLRGAHRNLSRLGSRPLGEVIFSYPMLERLEMQIVCVKPGAWARQLAVQIPVHEPIWGRRTVYAIRHRQLLVSEFFLSELLQAQGN